MKSWMFATVITVCLALTGRAAAGSAWDAITSVDYPELATTAALLEELGQAGMLKGRFTGTLLLPDNNAWAQYISGTDYLPTKDALGGKAEAGFFATLMRYHTLQRAVANPTSGTWNTKHAKERGNSWHTVTFQSGFASAIVVGEQGGSASIASGKSQQVTGGGYIHVIDTVVQPYDLFRSLSGLMGAREDLGNIAELLQEMRMETMWSNACNFGDYTIGDAIESMTPSPSHSCASCSVSANTCGPYFYEPRAGMGPQGLVAFADMIQETWDDRVTRAIAAGTLPLERFAGTFLLPSNTALPNISARTAKEWMPTLQFHFISVAGALVQGSNNQLMRFTNGGFPKPNPRRNFLGQMIENKSYQTTFVSLSRGCRSPYCLSVQYPTQARMDSAKIVEGAVNLQTANVLYHIIDKVMVPPCGNDDMCYAFFRKP